MPWSRSPRLLQALTWLILLFLLAPMLVIVPVSLTPFDYFTLPSRHFSVRHYHTLFTDPEWLRGFKDSLIIAITVSVLSVTAGTAAAIGLWRRNTLLSRALRVLLMAPIMIPTITSALGFYDFFAEIRLLDTFPGVTIAHFILATPYVLIAVSGSLANFDIRLEYASRSMGASIMQTIRYVILPQIKPGLIAGAVFAFLISWDETVVTLFISGRTVYTLPRKMWDSITERFDPTMAAAATVLFVATVAAMSARALLMRRPAADAAAAEF